MFLLVLDKAGLWGDKEQKQQDEVWTWCHPPGAGWWWPWLGWMLWGWPAPDRSRRFFSSRLGRAALIGWVDGVAG